MMNGLNIIPPFNIRQFTNKDGTLTTDAFIFLSQLIQALQQTISTEGLKVPLQTTANIMTLNTTLSTSNILYDTETNEFKGNVNGTYKVFTLT